MAVDGPFAAWPRGRTLPRPKRTSIVISEPIPASQVAAMSDEELASRIRRQIQDCHKKANAVLDKNAAPAKSGADPDDR